jgi:hypothetical protein
MTSKADMSPLKIFRTLQSNAPATSSVNHDVCTPQGFRLVHRISIAISNPDK